MANFALDGGLKQTKCSKVLVKSIFWPCLFLVGKSCRELQALPCLLGAVCYLALWLACIKSPVLPLAGQIRFQDEEL